MAGSPSTAMKSTKGRVKRREFLVGAGLGVAAAVLARPARAQPKGPINISFWTFDNPQQRPWIQKRVKLFTEKNPNVKVDFQWFSFPDLGKKLSVGFATGTSPDGFVSQDWFMPTWFSKDLLAPLDVQQLGYPSMEAFKNDFAPAFVAGASRGDKIYGFPLWFYGYLNYLNTKQFKEVGLDPEKDQPQTWEQLGEVARRLTIKDGNRFARQGFKFAMHAAQWTMIQFNPILIGAGGQWFDKDGKCTINNEAGVKAMTIRASIARQYGAEDPADTIATNPIPQMDWVKERCSMFMCMPQPVDMIRPNNPEMAAGGWYRPVQYPGVVPEKRISTTYGFNFVISARAPKEKHEVLHSMYRFIMSDLQDCWNDTAPFPLARKSGWADSPAVQSFPHVDEILKSRDQGIYLPRTVVVAELADALHTCVQKVMLNNGDIKACLDEAAATTDRAMAEYKQG